MKLAYFLLALLLIMARNACIGCGTGHDTARALNVHRKSCKTLRNKMDASLRKRKENSDSMAIVQKAELPAMSTSSNVFPAFGGNENLVREVFIIHSTVLTLSQAMDMLFILYKK